MEVAIREEYEVEVVMTIQECIELYNKSTDDRNRAIYDASKHSEEEFAEFIETVGIGLPQTKNVIKYEEAKEFYKNPDLSLSKPLSIELKQGTYQRLAGATPQDRESNLQDVYKQLGKVPDSVAIEIYNALHAHAENENEKEMANYVFGLAVYDTPAIKDKLRASKSKPYSIHKLYDSYMRADPEAVKMSIIETNKRMVTGGTREQAKEIKELKEELERKDKEVTILRNRLKLFESTIDLKQLKWVVKMVNDAYKKLTDMNGSPEFKEALDALCLRPNFTLDELKKAYREKVSLYHTDKPEGDDVIFRKIIKANEYLKTHIKGV